MNVDSPEFLLNPYPFYAKLRAQTPAHQRSDFEWTLTGFKELSKFLAHPDAGRGNIGQSPRPDGDTSELQKLMGQNPALQMLDRWMLFQNPPKHTRTRGRIADVFTSKIVGQLESSIRESLRKILRPLSVQEDSFDFFSAVAYPYPLTVVCDLVGIPAADRTKFSAWTRDFALAVQVDFHRLPEHKKRELNDATHAVQTYFSSLIPRKTEAQADDLMTRFLNRNADDLDAQELLANCVFLLFAGQDTTTCLLTNAVYALLTHPAQFQLLREQPALIDNAVEECLRFDPSIQMVGRYALNDIELDDHIINKGNHVFAFLGAAGRDPLVNTEPDKFDITREGIKHLAFARGAHHCLGATLARLEIKILLEELVDYFPQLKLAGRASRRPTWLMRGLDSMPVES